MCFVGAGARLQQNAEGVGTGRLPVRPTQPRRFEDWLPEGAARSSLEECRRAPATISSNELTVAEPAVEGARSGDRMLESVRSGRRACSSAAMRALRR